VTIHCHHKRSADKSGRRTCWGSISIEEHSASTARVSGGVPNEGALFWGIVKGKVTQRQTVLDEKKYVE